MRSPRGCWPQQQQVDKQLAGLGAVVMRNWPRQATTLLLQAVACLLCGWESQGAHSLL